MGIRKPDESLSSLPLEDLKTVLAEKADSIAERGNWPDHQRKSAAASLTSRIPTNINSAAGFDAGMACALDLIPKGKQKLSASLHAAYTPELVAQIRKEMKTMDPDCETAWWLAACHICDEDDGVDEEGFRKQIKDFEDLSADPQKRQQAASSELQRKQGLFETETYGIPFGTKDGCMQAAYINGYPVAAQYSSGYGIYFIGTYEESLGLEDFQWSTETDDQQRPKSGPVWSSKQFVKCANEEEFRRAIEVVKAKVGTKAEQATTPQEIDATAVAEDQHGQVTDLVPDANEKYSKAKEAVMEKYPELIEDLERSFKTPQLGAHHTEGPTMQSHLALIVEGFDKLQNGEVHIEIQDEELKRLLVDTVRANPELFRDYAFLHDIAKADCLRLTLESAMPDGENRVEITWEDWQEIEKAGEPYVYRKDGLEFPITAIGYFHQSKGKEGNHGNVGANLIEKKLGERKPADILLTAIRMHETAFQQFDNNCDVDRYEEEYGSFSEEQLRFIFVASYIDFAGSKTESGTPDFSPLMNVLTSKRNAELLRRFKTSGAKFPDNKVNPLKKKNSLLTVDELEAIRLKEKQFTKEELAATLGSNLDAAGLSIDEKEQLFTDIIADPIQWGKKWGQKLGRNVGTVKAALATCGTDTFVLGN